MRCLFAHLCQGSEQQSAEGWRSRRQLLLRYLLNYSSRMSRDRRRQVPPLGGEHHDFPAAILRAFEDIHQLELRVASAMVVSRGPDVAADEGLIRVLRGRRCSVCPSKSTMCRRRGSGQTRGGCDGGLTCQRQPVTSPNAVGCLAIPIEVECFGKALVTDQWFEQISDLTNHVLTVSVIQRARIGGVGDTPLGDPAGFAPWRRLAKG
jgi:hypothetical protein